MKRRTLSPGNGPFGLQVQWLRLAKQVKDPVVQEKAIARARRLLGEPGLDTGAVGGLLESGILTSEELGERL